MTKPPNVLMDSGAFSAWSLGQPLDLKRYIAFLRDHAALFSQYVALDQIPKGPADAEVSAKASYRNLQLMKDSGLRPMPVFHRGESFKWLDRLLRDGETYIGLSPRTTSTQRQKREWLDGCFRIIPKDTRCHGFAVTSLQLVKRYPWASVDSSTWARLGGLGRIPMPRFNGDQPDYTLRPILLAVSEFSPTGPHIDLLDGFRFDRLRDFLHGLGMSLAEVRYCPMTRKSLWAHVTAQMVGTNSSATMFFSTNTSSVLRRALHRAGQHDHLLSFFEFNGKPARMFPDYMAGRMPKRQPMKADWASKRYVQHRAMSVHRRVGLTD